MLGSVSMKYYWYYIQAFGPFIFVMVFIMAIAQNAAQAATNFWLSEWSDAGANLTANVTKVGTCMYDVCMHGQVQIGTTHISQFIFFEMSITCEYKYLS